MHEEVAQFYSSVNVFDKMLEQVANDERFLLTHSSSTGVRYELRQDVAEKMGFDRLSLQKFGDSRDVSITDTKGVVETGELYSYDTAVKYEVQNLADEPANVDNIPYMRRNPHLAPFESMHTYNLEPVYEMVRRTKTLLYPSDEPANKI